MSTGYHLTDNRLSGSVRFGSDRAARKSWPRPGRRSWRAAWKPSW